MKNCKIGDLVYHYNYPKFIGNVVELKYSKSGLYLIKAVLDKNFNFFGSWQLASNLRYADSRKSIYEKDHPNYNEVINEIELTKNLYLKSIEFSTFIENERQRNKQNIKSINPEERRKQLDLMIQKDIDAQGKIVMTQIYENDIKGICFT